MQNKSLNILNGTLEDKKDIHPEDYEEDFNQLVIFAQRGDYSSLIENSEYLIETGIYDIRIIAYSLYGLISVTGSKDIAPYVRCIVKLLSKDMETLLPERKKEMHIRKSLVWFLDQVERKMSRTEAHSGNKGTDYSELKDLNIDENINELDNLANTLESIFRGIEFSFPDSLVNLKNWYIDLKEMVLNDNTETDITDSSEVQSLPDTSIEINRNQLLDIAGYYQNLMTEDSHNLRLFLLKLKLFEKLMDKSEYTKAAIVQNDIFQEIDAFDPRLYFPGLFKKFLALQADNIQELSAIDMGERSPEITILKEYYQVDMEGFLNHKI